QRLLRDGRHRHQVNLLLLLHKEPPHRLPEPVDLRPQLIPLLTEFVVRPVFVHGGVRDTSCGMRDAGYASKASGRRQPADATGMKLSVTRCGGVDEADNFGCYWLCQCRYGLNRTTRAEGTRATVESTPPAARRTSSQKNTGRASGTHRHHSSMWPS